MTRDLQPLTHITVQQMQLFLHVVQVDHVGSNLLEGLRHKRSWIQNFAQARHRYTRKLLGGVTRHLLKEQLSLA